MEDELEETKKTLFELSSQRDNSAKVKELQAENQRLLAELERARQSRVWTDGSNDCRTICRRQLRECKKRRG